MNDFVAGVGVGLLLASLALFLADDIRRLVKKEVARALEADIVGPLPAVPVKNGKVVA